MAGGEVVHRLLKVALSEQQMVGVLERHVGADLAQRLQGGGDVCLSLVAEEALVARLSERGGGVHNRLGEGVVGDAAVRREVVGVPWFPTCGCAFGPDSEQDEVVLPAEVLRHCRERLPIESFVVDTQAAPSGLILEDLEKERSNA